MKFTFAVAAIVAMVSADEPTQTSMSAAEINNQYESENLDEQLKVFHQDGADNSGEDDDEALVQDAHTDEIDDEGANESDQESDEDSQNEENLVMQDDEFEEDDDKDEDKKEDKSNKQSSADKNTED